jgi:3-oxoacid CoA-transferase A subunit
MNKIVSDSRRAIEDVEDGASIMVGGFGACGTPENLIRALLDKGVGNLTIISNNPGLQDFGIGWLLKAGQVSRMILSYAGDNRYFGDLVLSGKLDVEFSPQGTLAERIRAGGAGIAGFYTPTGYGTMIAEGKEAREFDGRMNIFERALRADFAFVRAWRGDDWGNLVYRMTARNFNPVMATAARTTIAEVEEVVARGTLDPDGIHTPGIHVQRVFQGTRFDKPIENLTVRPRAGADSRTGEDS